MSAARLPRALKETKIRKGKQLFHQKKNSLALLSGRHHPVEAMEVTGNGRRRQNH
jgi:hypothetical protein